MGNDKAKTLNILVCDDHGIVRLGLRTLLAGRTDMHLAGEAVDGREAIVMADRLQPDVIIMDLVMPRMDGVTAITEIKKKNPAARILVFTGFSDDAHVFHAIRSGADGYLLKDSDPEELLQAIKDVHQGKSALHPVVAQKVIHELHQPKVVPTAGGILSEREKEVLQHVARGLSNTEIARSLAIREGTVRIHVGNILNKLQLSNRTQATLYALREGIAELETGNGLQTG